MSLALNLFTVYYYSFENTSFKDEMCSIYICMIIIQKVTDCRHVYSSITRVQWHNG